MQVLRHWRREGSKKRAAEESVDIESSRKRTKDDDNGRRQVTESAIATGPESDLEYKIRGTSTTITKDHPASPVASEPVPSPSSVHPDRLANIINAAPTPPPSATASHQRGRNSPLKPLSPNPEPSDRRGSEEQRPNPLHPTSTQPSLRIDTIRTLSSLDPRSPDYTPTMTSTPNEKSHDSLSHGPRKESIDSSRHNSNPPSRRSSDAMPPPVTFARITPSETSTPKAMSPPTNSESERRQPSAAQPDLPLLENLNVFAQSITSAASLTVRRDLTKQSAVEQQRERDRQSKFKATFLTLVEDAELRVENIEKASVVIEKQIDLNSQTQSNTTVALAAQMHKQGEVSNALPSAHDQTRAKDDFAEMKAELRAVKKDIDINRSGGRFKDDLLADLKRDVKAARKEIDYLKREAVTPSELRNKLRPMATKDELRELADKDEIREFITKDELRRVTIEEVRRHVTEALIPTEKKLGSLTLDDANMIQKIKSMEALAQKHRETTESKDQQQSSRFDHLESSLNNLQREFGRLDITMQEHKEDYAAGKVVSEAQNELLADLKNQVGFNPSSGSGNSSLHKSVIENSDQIRSLQERLDETFRQIQDLQATSALEAPPQVSKAVVDADTKLDEEIKLVRCGLDDSKAKQQKEFQLIRHDLDASKIDQEELALIRTDLDSLIDGEKRKDENIAQLFEANGENLTKFNETLFHLQTEIRLLKQTQATKSLSNPPPTPPPASASMSPREPHQRKLQEFEIGLRTLTKALQGLDMVVNSQQRKFDGLSSDHIIQTMVHQMQQMYPQHPGWLKEWQGKVDNYLGVILRDRLAIIESQISESVRDADSKIQGVTQSTADFRKICFATVNNLKQHVAELRDKACRNDPQCHSDHDNRINDLTNRIAVVEVSYVKAIDDIQTNQKDLMCNFTRNGVGAASNTTGEFPVTSRSSKSVELSANAIQAYETINESDNSDTPLSQRADRGPRRDTEDLPSFEPKLKRKAAESDGEDEDEGTGASPTNMRKVPKRWNVSGRSPLP